MLESNTNELLINDVNLKTRSPIQRLTAFWAFSEAGLGGVLHLTRLPFKGILIAGAATLFITLITQFSKIKGNILRSTVLVIVVKYLVSPYTPITAAIAVFAQGLLGELFFSSQRFRKILIPAFSIFIQFITAVQKILIVTILFGQNFWIAVDDLANSILNQFTKVERIEFSYLIIVIYIAVHVVAGLLVGLFILKLIKYLNEAETNGGEKIIEFKPTEFSVTNAASKKHWFQKPSGLIILIFVLVVLGLSFFLPDWTKSNFVDIILMIVRAIIIIALWYILLAPMLRKILSKLLSKHKTKRLEEIDDILQFFPMLKQIVIFSWNNSKSYRGIKRIKTFIFRVILYALAR
ncbi:MAG: hypothetical protein A2W30_06965 [Ignavibacteria bacterium RBG_16_36_9]|nr:MAG: hypothetical protein A2W30_06965 [Ignavibacteria bacterium RBG_16_36_9]